MQVWYRSFGTGLPWAIFFFCMFNYPLFGFTDPSSKANNPFNMGFLVTLAFALVILGLITTTNVVKAQIGARTRLSIVAGICVTAGLGWGVLLNIEGITRFAPYIASGVLTSLGLSVYLYFWFCDISALTDRMLRFILPLNFIVASLLTIMTLALPRMITLILCVAICAISTFCIIANKKQAVFCSIKESNNSKSEKVTCTNSSQKDSYKSFAQNLHKRQFRFLFRRLERTDRLSDIIVCAISTVILSFIYTLVGQVALSVPETQNSLNLMTVTDMGLAALLALFIGSISNAKVNSGLFYKIIFSILATALFFLLFLGETYWVVFNNLVVLSYYLFHIRLFILVTMGFKQERDSGIILLLIVTGLAFGISLVGVGIGAIITRTGGFDAVRLSVIAFACVYVMVMGLLLIISRPKRGKQIDLKDDDWHKTKGEVRRAVELMQRDTMASTGKPLWSLSDAELDNLCDRFSAHYRLTRREREILPFIVRGKTASEISETLVLSTSTIKGHMRTLYRKCNVHSKEELIASLTYDQIAFT
ncbi:MAG: LuxR C-terminal-related transcriptional regulator [Coriobacteriales bacterium]|jgi:DNA-binding CsgD family transcriptional regulator|nr:LuxR C-terminal-related transcriptional regulator [Coriobacteriales bacterium]